jgi:hypothetical protein
MRQNKRSKTEPNSGFACDVDVYFEGSALASVTVPALQNLLSHKLTNVWEPKSYVACTTSNSIQIFDGVTWEHIQTVANITLSDNHICFFLNKNELITKCEKALKVWSIPHAKYTRTVESLFDPALVYNNYLVLHDASILEVWNTFTEKMSTKDLEHNIDHVCARDRALTVAHDNGLLVVLNIVTLDVIRRIDTKLENVTSAWNWFGTKMIISREHDSFVFDTITYAKEERERLIEYTRILGDRIITIELDYNWIVRLWKQNEEPKEYPIDFGGCIRIYNPFGIVGSQILVVKDSFNSDEDHNNLMIYDLETRELIKEIKGNFVQVSTW